MSGLHDFIFIIWVIFWIYWVILATQSKSNKHNSYHAFLGLRFIILLIFLLLIRVSGIRSDIFTNHDLITHNIILEIIGTVLLIMGLSFAVWARINLGKNWGMPMTRKTEPELVTSGPYRYVRHPIYTALILASLGTAIAIGAYLLVIFFVFIFYFTFSARREEDYLSKEFGNTYMAYKKKSKMLIPFLF
jgi:protein-S-isoprenylcysteine O-methyltransferase Ste14